MQNEDKKLSSPLFNWEELLSNRTKFKLYSARQHLKNLKDIESSYNSSVESPEIRIQTEIALDCFLNSLISAKESLLFIINEKLKLGLPSDKANLKAVNYELYKIKKTKVLCKLTYLSKDEYSWLSFLNELRNHSHHRTNISRDIHVEVGTKNPPEVYLIDPRDQRLSKDERRSKKLEELIAAYSIYLNNNTKYNKNKNYTDDEMKEFFNDFLENYNFKKKEMMILTLEELFKNMEQLINEIEIALK